MPTYVVNPIHRKKRRRTKARKARRASARRSRVVHVMQNPSPKRRRRSFRRAAAKRARRFVSRAKRATGFQGILNQFVPAATGAAGALVLDVALGYLPIPETLKTGPMAPVVKAGLVIGAGMVARNVVPKRFVDAGVAGALTIIAYNTLKGVLKTAMPQLPGLGEDEGLISLGYISPGSQLSGYVNGYASDELGNFVPRDAEVHGYVE